MFEFKAEYAGVIMIYAHTAYFLRLKIDHRYCSRAGDSMD